MNKMPHIELNVNDLIGERLDKYISLKSSNKSRSKIKQLILEKKVLVNGKPSEPDYKITLNDKILINNIETNTTKIVGENIKLNIVHEDNNLIVINKPSGLVVHPGAGNRTGTLVHAIVHHSNGELSDIGNNERPGIVHRIDKNTSGLIVVAKDNFTHMKLSKQFSDHTIDREYVALVWGKVIPKKGKIESLLSRSNRNRKKMMSSNIKGKNAITHYKTIETLQDTKGNTVASLLLCKLETGRTHQIRVHLSENGNPIVGDKVYGRTPKNKTKYLHEQTIEIINSLDGQCLHAQTLGFIHPKTKKKHVYQCDIPKNLRNLIDSIKKQGIEK